MKKNSFFACQLLMDVGGVAPSEEKPAVRFDDLVDDTRMTAFELDLAEDENGEINLFALLLAKSMEVHAANWGWNSDLEVPDLEESRLRKRAMFEVERRHNGFRMFGSAREQRAFTEEFEAEMRRLKGKTATTNQKKAE